MSSLNFERGTITSKKESSASEATVDRGEEVLGLEELNDEDLKNAVDNFEKRTNVLRLENEMMIRYLVRNAQFDEGPLREQLDRLGERMLELEQIRKTRSLYSIEGKARRTIPGRPAKQTESGSTTNSVGSGATTDEQLQKKILKGAVSKEKIPGATEDSTDVPEKEVSNEQGSDAKEQGSDPKDSKEEGEKSAVVNPEVVADGAAAAVPPVAGGNLEAMRTAGSLHQTSTPPSVGSSASLVATPSGFMAFEKRGPRLNVPGKAEMVARELRDGQRELDTFEALFARKKLRLGQRLEVASVTADELRGQREAFEREVVVGGVHPVTGRIPAECFLRYLSKWSRANTLLSDKLRLRSATLRVSIRKVRVQLEEKRELGETLAPVDFEQQRINNERYLRTLEQKSLQVLQLKRLAGDCALQLSVHKKALLADRGFEDILHSVVEDRRKQCSLLEHEARQADARNERLRTRLDSLRTLTENFEAPPVLDYARICAKVTEQERELRMWRRRVNLQRTALHVARNSQLSLRSRHLRQSDRQFHTGHSPCDDVDDVNSAAFQNFWFGGVPSSHPQSRDGSKAGALDAVQEDTEEDEVWANISASYATGKGSLKPRIVLPPCPSLPSQK